MKRLLKPVFFLFFLALPFVACAQRVRLSEVYMFGAGINFADSTVYLTAVQRVDSVPLERSQGFLLNRYAYSDQLGRYLFVNAGKNNETCAVFFDTSRSKVEKQYLRLRRRFQKNKGLRIEEVPGDAFRFRGVSYTPRTASQQ